MDVTDFMDSGVRNFIIARDNIFKNRSVIDDYLTDSAKQSKRTIDQSHLDLLQALKNARYADFFAVRKGDAVYLIDYMKNNTIYEITGLSQEPWELIPNFPSCTRTALIEFEDHIVFDGLNHIKKQSYPKKAAALIMKDFENDLPTKLASKLEL